MEYLLRRLLLSWLLSMRRELASQSVQSAGRGKREATRLSLCLLLRPPYLPREWRCRHTCFVSGFALIAVVFLL